MRIFITLLSLLLVTATVTAQKTVSGEVADSEGIPLIGVNILEKGTSNGTISDLDGRFQLKVSDGANLVFSYTGNLSLISDQWQWLPLNGQKDLIIWGKEK